MHTLPTAQVPISFNRLSWSRDPFTQACKASPLTIVGWTSLSVSLSLSMSHFAVCCPFPKSSGKSCRHHQIPDEDREPSDEDELQLSLHGTRDAAKKLCVKLTGQCATSATSSGILSAPCMATTSWSWPARTPLVELDDGGHHAASQQRGQNSQ